MFALPRLYPILDAESCVRRGLDLFAVAQIWAEAGVGIVQYRDKRERLDDILSNALRLKKIFESTGARLVMNDSPELAREAGLDCVHVGQTDGLITVARTYVPFVGISTHTTAQVIAADGSDAAYVAIGPVYGTTTKSDAAPVVGLDGVERARRLTTKPLVAIGGITLDVMPKVYQAGADSIAVISALLEGDAAVTIRNFLDVANAK